jgi:acyl carrier protein
MSEVESRLLDCFSSVFPGLTNDEIREVSTASQGAWDSLATVTLAALIQEQFNLEIDPEVLPDLNSFEAFRNYISRSGSRLDTGS